METPNDNFSWIKTIFRIVYGTTLSVMLIIFSYYWYIASHLGTSNEELLIFSTARVLDKTYLAVAFGIGDQPNFRGIRSACPDAEIVGTLADPANVLTIFRDCSLTDGRLANDWLFRSKSWTVFIPNEELCKKIDYSFREAIDLIKTFQVDPFRGTDIQISIGGVPTVISSFDVRPFQRAKAVETGCVVNRLKIRLVF